MLWRLLTTLVVTKVVSVIYATSVDFSARLWICTNLVSAFSVIRFLFFLKRRLQQISLPHLRFSFTSLLVYSFLLGLPWQNLCPDAEGRAENLTCIAGLRPRNSCWLFGGLGRIYLHDASMHLRCFSLSMLLQTYSSPTPPPHCYLQAWHYDVAGWHKNWKGSRSYIFSHAVVWIVFIPYSDCVPFTRGAAVSRKSRSHRIYRSVVSCRNPALGQACWVC